MKQVKILDVNVDAVSPEEAKEKITEFIRSKKPHLVITANSLMVNHASNDEYLKNVFNNAGLVVADSIGIVLAARLWGVRLRRIPGIDLMLELCSVISEKGYKVFLLGARDDVIRKAGGNLRLKFPSIKIAGLHHGYFKEDSTGEEEILDAIKSAKPDVLLVGLNTPYQEKWIYRHLKELNVPVCMGVGGSFDIISGRLRRAPRWMRGAGLEWFYRFWIEVWRLKRLALLPVFMYKVILQRIKK